MEKFRQFIKEHRTAALVSLFLILVFLGGSAMSAVNVAHQRAEASQQQEETTQNEASSEQQKEEETSPNLTDTQKKAIDGYDEETKTFLVTLSASVWSANNGTDTLRFTDSTYTETVNGEAVEHTYAITRFEKGTDTAGAEIDTAVFETDTGTHVVRYICQKGTGEVTDTLSASLSSSSAFQLTDIAYERQDPVQNLVVQGLNEEVSSLLGGAEALTTEMSKWCAAYYPTAATATWENTATIDYSANIVTAAFALGNGDDTNQQTSGAAIISVTYHRDDGTYEFGV